MKKIKLKVSPFWLYLAAQLLWLLAVPVVKVLNLVVPTLISHMLVMLVGVIGYYFLYKQIFLNEESLTKPLETESLNSEEDLVEKVKNKDYRGTPLSECGWFVVINDDNFPSTLILPWEVIHAIKYKFKMTSNENPLKVSQIETFFFENKISVNDSSVSYPRKNPFVSTTTNKISDCQPQTDLFDNTKFKESLKYRENGETFGKETNDFFVAKSYKERFEKLLKDNKYPSSESFNQWYKQFQIKEKV